MDKEPYASKRQAMEEIKAQLDIKHKMQKLYNANVKSWVEFSLAPRTEEEIKERVIYDNLHGTETICISYICKFSKLSEGMIDWLCENTVLTDRSTRKKTNKVDWDYISSFQTLSEDFIEKHSKDVNWKFIFQYQNVSKEFRRKHQKEFTEFSSIEIV